MELPDDLRPQRRAPSIARVKDEIYKDGLARGLPVFDINKADIENGLHRIVEFYVPAFLLAAVLLAPCRPTGSVHYRRNLPVRDLFARARAKDDPRPRSHRASFPAVRQPGFPEIPRQDYSNLPLQQQGLHAEGFEYMRLSNRSEGMISNYQRLIDGYLAGCRPQKLAGATQVVNSGFEAPVLDIGF